jgi:glycosyltransferase involved in cell wall biosynthesis
VRVLGLLGRRALACVVLSQPFSWQHGRRVPPLDRWLMRRVARIVVQGDAEAHLGEQQGLFLDKLAVIPPGIAAEEPAATVSSGPKKDHRKIVCIGPLEEHKGYRDALWAFDILRHVFDDIRLAYLGDGPERPALERFGRAIECDHLIDFAGTCARVEHVLRDADVCWVPSRRGGGTHSTLEAMLAGLPVVACRVPNLHGLIVDGQSGFVVAPGDKVGLARRTRQILIDPALSRQLGHQARRRVVEHFEAGHFLQRCRRMYHELAA